MQQTPKKETETQAQQNGLAPEHPKEEKTLILEKDKKSLDDKDRKLQELTDIAKRLQADFENYKKRAEKEHQNQIKLGKAIIIKRLLPVLDTFEQALKQNPADNGLKLVHQQLISALEAEGLKEIKAEGRLDPYKHECLCEVCSPKEKGMITEEIRKGYMLDDLMIRHSLVRVSNGKKDEKEGENDNLKKNT